MIFDNRSGLLKAGVTGDSGPTSVLTAIVGHSKVKPTMLRTGHKECHTGEETQSEREIVSLNCPIDCEHSCLPG